MAKESNPSASADSGAAQFATTHWSAVLAAGDSALRESAASLEWLCRTYWYPLYAFVRRKGYDPEDAKDLTQAFFERFLEKHFVKQVVPERGHFRTFLLTAATHFLANEWDRVKAAKRGGQFTFIPLDAAIIEERYRALIRAEVRQTVNTTAEVEAEMRYLVELISE